MKAYETKKKLALSLAVAMVASSAPVLAFADTAIVAQAEAEMTVEEIIASVSAAINDPFLAAGLARIEAGEAAVATLPDGATKTALTETLQTARHMYDGLEQINQIWVALGAAGWQTNYGKEVAELQAIIAQLDAAFPGGSAFLDNFKTAVTETELTYDAFVAMDVAAVNPTAANIAAAKEAVSKIMNPVAKTNAELRIKTEIESQKLAVVSVSAINAKEVEIKFNRSVKAADVVTGGNLNTTNVKITPLSGANPLGTITATLSNDGKTLKAVAGAGQHFDGQYAIVVEPTLEDVDGNKIKAFSQILTVNDTVRPLVEKVEYVNFQTVKVTFSEPLNNLGTVTPSISDISNSALSADGKSFTIDLSDSNVEVNKDYTVTIIGARDYANNLITPNPTVITVKKTQADTEKPVVEAITLKSDTEFSVKFSEKLIAAPTITVSGPVTTTVTQDSDDDTLYNVTISASAAGVRTITVSAFADLSNNAGETYSKVVTFVADNTDPKLVTSKVEKINGVEHLILTFDENVVPQDSIAISGKHVKDFVETNMSITTDLTNNFELNKPVNGKSKSVQLNVGSLVAGEYTLNLPVGLVEDEAGNSNEAKSVTFTRTSDTDVNKPQLDTSVDGNGILKIDNNNYSIHFDKQLEVASALNLANYVIEGVTVKSAIFTQNNSGGAVVRLTLEEGSVALTGDRTVTIKNIKSNDGVMMDTVNTVETFTENVRPVVNSAKLTAENKITVVFSEDIAGITTADLEVYVGTETTPRALSGATLTGKTVVLELTANLQPEDLTKEITVKRASNNIEDLAGNKLSFTSIIVAQ